MTYEYKRPEGKEYKVSIKEWNKVFANRGSWPFIKCSVFLNGSKGAVVEFKASLFTKALLVVFAPAFYIYRIFICGFSEAHKEYLDIIYDQKRGKFSREEFSARHGEAWRKLMVLIII